MIWWDSESYSTTSIKDGTYKYVSTAELMVGTFAQDDAEVEVWDRTAEPDMPLYLEHLLLDTDEPISSHNAMFDRNLLKYSLGIDIPIERWRCTMVRALAHALPGGLDKLCELFEVKQDDRKRDGRQLIRLFCMPQRPKKGVSTVPWRADRHTHPDEWAEFLEYAKADIKAMRVIDGKLPKWNYQGFELEMYHLDQRINDRGMYVDVELAEGAVRAVETERVRLNQRTVANTHGMLDTTTKRDKMLMYLLAAHGVMLDNLQASTVERRISDPDLPIELRELLAIRLQATTTSTSKYKALLKGVMPDHRLRGTSQFCGAGRTRRWAHRSFQPGNLPRPTVPKKWIDVGIDALKGDYADLVTDNVMALAASAVRGCIVAPPGKKLVIADLANIEGRDQAWFAGEEWKLQAFRDYDAGTGPDLYKLAYAKAFRVTPAEVVDHQRQIGKVLELMLGYGGGAGAFVTGALAYDIDLEQLADDIYDYLPDDLRVEAEKLLLWFREKGSACYGLSDKVFVMCDTLKRMWRGEHPEIVSLWDELEQACKTATLYQHETIRVRKLLVRRDGNWLRVGMPSGRALVYPAPTIVGKTLTYMGMNQYTRKWQRLKTYGGKLFENLCQSCAGDFLKASMPLMEAAGYQIVMTVHDEVITEAPDTADFNAKQLSSILATPPHWGEGMPLAAAGFETYRYRKG